MAGSGWSRWLASWRRLIDEGHLGKFSDTSLVLERLKAISGGSEQTVDRKGLAAMPSVALKVRFTIALNELPRLSDSSAAMRSRLLVLPYFNSYEGQEDIGLLDRLLAEIPGITNWALEGLRLLRNVGRFRNPTAGEKILRDFVYLSSPIQAFLDECCEVETGKEVRRQRSATGLALVRRQRPCARQCSRLWQEAAGGGSKDRRPAAAEPRVAEIAGTWASASPPKHSPTSPEPGMVPDWTKLSQVSQDCHRQNEFACDTLSPF